MIVDIECPRCDGSGEVLGATPNVRARYVRYDDLDPGDFGDACPKCGGIGVVSCDLAEEIEDLKGELHHLEREFSLTGVTSEYDL